MYASNQHTAGSVVFTACTIKCPSYKGLLI